MALNLLLDTCAVIWLSQDEPLDDSGRDAIEALATEGGQLMVSPITAWEIGLLVSRGRLPLTMDSKDWFRSFLRKGEVTLAPLSPETLIDSSFLPENRLKDPADRIIVATARAMDMPILTRDRHILAYAEAGHVNAISC